MRRLAMIYWLFKWQAEPLFFSLQILMAVQRIVNSLGLECPSTYPLVIPILQQCTTAEEVKEGMDTQSVQTWMCTRSSLNCSSKAALFSRQVAAQSILCLVSILHTIKTRHCMHQVSHFDTSKWSFVLRLQCAASAPLWQRKGGFLIEYTPALLLKTFTQLHFGDTHKPSGRASAAFP